MKLTKSQLKRIIKEELGRDAVTYDIKMIAQAYESGVTGETELRRDIQSGTVKGI